MMNEEHACYIFFLLYVTLLERMEAAVYCSSDPRRRSDALFAFPQP